MQASLCRMKSEMGGKYWRNLDNEDQSTDQCCQIRIIVLLSTSPVKDWKGGSIQCQPNCHNTIYNLCSITN